MLSLRFFLRHCETDIGRTYCRQLGFQNAYLVPCLQKSRNNYINYVKKIDIGDRL